MNNYIEQMYGYEKSSLEYSEILELARLNESKNCLNHIGIKRLNDLKEKYNEILGEKE